MKAKPTALAFGVLAAVAAAFGYGRWSARRPSAATAAPATALAEPSRRVVAYQCAMHPEVRSERPGQCPICNMLLEPVYADAPAEDSGRVEPRPAVDAGTAFTAGPASAGLVHISPERQQLIGVEYGEVQDGPVSKAIRAAAKVEADENRTIRVQSKLEGWIDELYVGVIGTLVHKDQILLTVYNAESQSVQADLIKHAPGGMRMTPVAAPSPQRGAALAQNGPLAPLPVAAPALDPSGPALFASDAFKLKTMGFDERIIMMIAKSGVPLDKVPVYSPTEGFVIECNAFLKQKMTPDPLYTIADLASVYVTADVFEYEAGAIRVGQPVTFTMPYLAGKTITGHVAAILPIADPTSHTVKVRARYNNTGYFLKPGMYGDLTIDVAETRRVTVPEEAVLDTGLKRIVFVDRGDGFLEPREIVTGQHFGDRIEVIEGLQAGQRIVTSGNFLVDSESQLKTRGPH